jgi:hypothetical protein
MWRAKAGGVVDLGDISSIDAIASSLFGALAVGLLFGLITVALTAWYPGRK